MKSTPARPRRAAALLVAALLTIAGVAGTGSSAIAAPAAGPSARSSISSAVSAIQAALTAKKVTVSLTFDDANGDQVAAAQTLVNDGLRGTFFLNSGFLGAPGYMTKAQVQALAAAGHEIGGHTVNHPDLIAISLPEVQRQVCQDRTNLSALGVSVSDFAYPFADSNADIEKIVQACGYNSARSLGDIASKFGCTGCEVAETTPPADAYDTAALDEVESTWTLADLERPITAAAKTGGWVQYTFHHICPTGTTCADPQITSALFTQFAQWLRQKTLTSLGTVQVKTVAQVINKPVQPVVSASYPAPAAAGVNALQNPSLETQDPYSGLPYCYMKGGYGTNTPTFATTSAAHTGSVASLLTVAGYTDGDAKLLPVLDLGMCAPTVQTGHTYSLREWYESSGVTQFALYLRDPSGAWTYWTSSPWFASASAWTQAVWTTPAIPAGYTGLSFGLNIFANGTLTTDDYAMYDSVGAPDPAATADTTSTGTVAGAQSKGTVQAVTTGTDGQ